MPLHYYDAEFKLDGTAKEMCRDAYHGYIDNADTLRKIRDFVRIDLSCREGSTDLTDMHKINALIEEIEEKKAYPDAEYNVGRMKYEFLDGFRNFEDFRFFEDASRRIDVSVLYAANDSLFVFALTETSEDGVREGVCCTDKDELMRMTHKTFEKMLNECYYYAMSEIENEPDEDREER